MTATTPLHVEEWGTGDRTAVLLHGLAGSSASWWELGPELARRGFDLALWDATTDLGVATVLCALTDAEAPRSPAGFGSGCHPDRGIAALRAITEAAQTRAIAISGVGAQAVTFSKSES